MSVIIPGEELSELIVEEQKIHERDDGLYQRCTVPVGCAAVGKNGEEAGIAEIIIEQMVLVDNMAQNR